MNGVGRSTARSGRGRGGAQGGDEPAMEGRSLTALLAPFRNERMERVVLACIILKWEEAWPYVEGRVDPSDFYDPRHRAIFEAILSLIARQKPIDMHTLTNELGSRLDAVGGAAYLDDLCGDISSVAYIETYVHDLTEAGIVRAVQEVAVKTLMGAGSRSADEVLALASEMREALEGRGKVDAFTPIDDAMVMVIDRITSGADRGGRIGRTYGLRELDALTGGATGGQLIIKAARPAMGKTSLALKSMRAMAQESLDRREEGIYLFFSCEMPRTEIAQRQLCQESRVDESKVRQIVGLTQDELNALNDGAHKLARLPIQITDGIDTIQGINAACYRARLKHGAVLGVFIDYLQLLKDTNVRARRGNYSREQEMAEVSRALKKLAKELDCPVVALAQLNRKCEERADKRPMLADLRECLPGDQRIYDADSGLYVRIRDVVARGGAMSVVGLDATMKARKATLVEAWSSGIKPVFRLRTRTGRVLRATANHPLLTIEGWRPLGSLEPGTRIAAPRVLPEATEASQTVTRDEAVLLGMLVADGTYLRRRSVGYVKGDPEMVAEVRRIALARFGIRAKKHRCHGPSEQIELTTDGPKGPGNNPIIEWLKGLGIYNQKSQEKRAPEAVMRGNNAVAAAFLGALWCGDGTITKRSHGTHWAVKYTSTSAGLLDDVMVLLGRLGIVAVRGTATPPGERTLPIATISITDSVHISRFASLVPMIGRKAVRLREAAARDHSNNASVDRLPIEVTDRVCAKRKAANLSHAGLGYRTQGKQMGRADLARVAERLGDASLYSLATSDVLWDEVVSITPDGEEEVFDFRVPDTGCAVVENLFVHNSGHLEQDADVIAFIYRDEVYNKQSEDRGIAEIIIGKQRSGPCDTVRTRFIKQYTLFEDMSAAEESDAPYRAGGYGKRRGGSGASRNADDANDDVPFGPDDALPPYQE